MIENILNSRVKRQIKDVLVDYAKYLGGFFVVSLIVITLLRVVLSMINIGAALEAADLDNIEYTVSEIINFLDDVNIFNLLNLFGLTLVMFISGIITGSELPAYVRKGVARNEYFKGTLIGAIIVSIALIPFSLIANQLVNLIAGSENAIHNAYHLGNGDLLITVMYIPFIIAFHLAGYFIAMIYQRFGWLIGVIITVFALLVTGIISWNSRVILIFPIFVVGEYNGLLDIPELLGPILVTISIILASGIYTLVKHTPVKVK